MNQLTILNECSTAILSTLKLEEVLELILKRLLEVAHLNRAGIFLFDENKNSLLLIHAVGVEPDTFTNLKGYQIPLDKKDNIIARTAREKKGCPDKRCGKDIP